MIRRDPTTIKLSDADVKEWKQKKQEILDELKKKEQAKGGVKSKEDLLITKRSRALEKKLSDRRKRIGVMSE